MGTWDIIRVTLDPEGKWKWLRHGTFNPSQASSNPHVPKFTTWGFPIHIHWSIILFLGPYWWSHYSILLMVNDSIRYYISINPSHQSFMVISSHIIHSMSPSWDMGHHGTHMSHLLAPPTVISLQGPPRQTSLHRIAPREKGRQLDRRVDMVQLHLREYSWCLDSRGLSKGVTPRKMQKLEKCLTK